MRRTLRLVCLSISLILLIMILLQKTAFGFFSLPNYKTFPYMLKKDIVMEAGESYKIHTFAINKRISYRTTDFKVAYVNLNGKVFARKPGVCYIHVKLGNKNLKCRVRVLKISRKHVLLSSGEQYQLRISGDGLISSNSWESSNHRVAVVSRFGKVTAKRKGRSIISCRVNGKTLTCIIKVE